MWARNSNIYVDPDKNGHEQVAQDILLYGVDLLHFSQHIWVVCPKKVLVFHLQFRQIKTKDDTVKLFSNYWAKYEMLQYQVLLCDLVQNG